MNTIESRPPKGSDEMKPQGGDGAGLDRHTSTFISDDGPPFEINRQVTDQDIMYESHPEEGDFNRN